MKPIAPIKRGPKVLRKWLNALLDAVTANRILRGPGYEIHEHPGGSQLILDTSAIVASASVSTPLMLIDASDGSPKGSIIYGTVKGMDVVPSPAAVADGDSAWVEITVSYDDTANIWSYNAVALTFGAAVPAPDATTMILNLGYFEVTGETTAPHPALTGSQDARRCGTPDAFMDDYGKQ